MQRFTAVTAQATLLDLLDHGAEQLSHSRVSAAAGTVTAEQRPKKLLKSTNIPQATHQGYGMKLEVFG